MVVELAFAAGERVADEVLVVADRRRSGARVGVAGEGRAASSSAKSVRAAAAAGVPAGMVLLAIVGWADERLGSGGGYLLLLTVTVCLTDE